MINYDNLIKTIVSPLVKYPADIVINHQDTLGFSEYVLKANPQDIGRVIGKHGKVAQTIRTILYGIPSNGNKRVKLIIDDGK